MADLEMATLDWPRARVRDRAVAPALGFTVLLGVIVAGLAARRGDPFGLLGGLCLLVGGVLQLRRPNLAGAGFRDARLFVVDGSLTIDGQRIDVARALRSDLKQGAAVVIEERKGSTVTVLCATREERRALLRALGAESTAPLVFGYMPTFARYLFSVPVVLCLYGAGAKALHLLPAELGWRWLWLLAIANVGVSIHRRIEISRDELRLHDLVVPLREIEAAEWESTKIGRTPAWLILRGNTFHPIKVLVADGVAERAAETIERRARRASARAKRSAAPSSA